MTSRVVIAGLCLLAGCVEFEKQTLLLRVKDGAATLRLVYQGIYAGGDDPVERAVEQLKEVAEGQQFYLLDNWPYGVDLAPPEPGKDDEPAARVLRDHATVRNRGFFRDADGKLCAWQDVELKDAPALLDKLNVLAGLAVVAEATKAKDDADKERWFHWARAAAAGHKWFSIDDGELAVHLPATPSIAVRMKEEMLAAEEEDADLLRKFLANNALSWRHGKDAITISLRESGPGLWRLDWWNPQEYAPNLEDGHLPLPLQEGITLEKLVGEIR